MKTVQTAKDLEMAENGLTRPEVPEILDDE